MHLFLYLYEVFVGGISCDFFQHWIMELGALEVGFSFGGYLVLSVGLVSEIP